MKAMIRRMGNSQGLIIPKLLLAQIGLEVDYAAELKVEGDTLLIRKPQKTGYTLDELIAQCNPKAPLPADMKDWQAAQPIGREAW